MTDQLSGLSTSTPTSLRYATWGERAAALLIEWVLLVAFSAVVGVPLFLASPWFGAIAMVASSVMFLYWQWLTGDTGQSPGKAAMGIRVVKADTGQPLGGGMGLVRYFAAAFISAITCGTIGGLIDYLFPLWDKRSQTLHDKMVGAVVLSDQPRRPLFQGQRSHGSRTTPAMDTWVADTLAIGLCGGGAVVAIVAVVSAFVQS